MSLLVYGVMSLLLLYVLFFFKQKTAYEMRISDWSSDVCSSDLLLLLLLHRRIAAILVDRAPLPLARRRQQHFLDDLAQGRSGAFDRTGQRIAAEGAKADRAKGRNLAGLARKAGVVDKPQQTVAVTRWPQRRPTPETGRAGEKVVGK